MANSSKQHFSPCFILSASYLYRISQRNSDSKWESLGNSNHEHSNTNNEEFNKILDVDRSALRQPLLLVDHKGVDGKIQYQDDDSDGRHHQTWEEKSPVTINPNSTGNTSNQKSTLGFDRKLFLSL